MKKFLIVGLLSIDLFALSPKQMSILNWVYNKAKPYNLQNTMSAIAYVESHLGRYKVNLQDGKYGSFGIFHNMLESVCSRHNCSTYWNKSRLAERLIVDKDFSFSEAMAEFQYWYNYWLSKGYSNTIAWKRAICSYNAGYNWKKGLKYYKKVVKAIKFLKKYIKV